MRFEFDFGGKQRDPCELISTLDATAEIIKGGTERATRVAIDNLCVELNEALASGAGGVDLARACRDHPIGVLLTQDPYTARALKKPRGYAVMPLCWTSFTGQLTCD